MSEINCMFDDLWIRDNLWDVVDLENQWIEDADKHMIPTWRSFLESQGMLKDFDEYRARLGLGSSLCRARNRDDDLSQEEREKQRIFRVHCDKVEDVDKLIMFFRKGPDSDPFFDMKVAACKRRLLGAVRCVRTIIADQQLEDLRWVASEYNIDELARLLENLNENLNA